MLNMGFGRYASTAAAVLGLGGGGSGGSLARRERGSQGQAGGALRAGDASGEVPSTAAAVLAYRPNPMFNNRAGSRPYPRWEAVCNVAVPPRASPWYRKVASSILKERSFGSPHAALVIGTRTAGEPKNGCEMRRVADGACGSAASRWLAVG